MAKSVGCARLILVAVALAVVASVCSCGSRCGEYVTMEKHAISRWADDNAPHMPINEHSLRLPAGVGMRGWRYTSRWSQRDLGGALYYLDSGFKAVEWDGNRRFSAWNPDGTLAAQSQDPPMSSGISAPWELKYSPPWWWNVTDQTTPSIPAWMKDDEQWQRALDAQD